MKIVSIAKKSLIPKTQSNFVQKILLGIRWLKAFTFYSYQKSNWSYFCDNASLPVYRDMFCLNMEAEYVQILIHMTVFFPDILFLSYLTAHSIDGIGFKSMAPFSNQCEPGHFKRFPKIFMQYMLHMQGFSSFKCLYGKSNEYCSWIVYQSGILIPGICWTKECLFCWQSILAWCVF